MIKMKVSIWDKLNDKWIFLNNVSFIDRLDNYSFIIEGKFYHGYEYRLDSVNKKEIKR